MLFEILRTLRAVQVDLWRSRGQGLYPQPSRVRGSFRAVRMYQKLAEKGISPIVGIGESHDGSMIMNLEGSVVTLPASEVDIYLSDDFAFSGWVDKCLDRTPKDSPKP